MFKKVIVVTMVVIFLIPVASHASYRFGAGAYMGGLISGGAEFRFYIPVSDNAGAFIVPHAFTILTSTYIWYSAGLRAGFMLRQDLWVSPLIGMHAGITGDEGSANVSGGRLFAGVSIAPLMTRSSPPKRADLLRIEIDMGLSFKQRSYDNEPEFWFPSIGGGINFSW